MHQPATYWCHVTHTNYRPWWRHKIVKTFFWKNFPEKPLTHAPKICQYGLRKPPLYAKNWENWGFQYLTIISVPKYSEPTDLLGLVELHSSSKFLRNLIMIHVRDVIKWSFYWTDQKPFTGHSSKIIHLMIFSNQNLVQFIRKECRYCFEISKKISDGQEMTECSKSLTNHTPEVRKIK